MSHRHVFRKFQESEDTLWVYVAGNLYFRSAEKGIAPLLTCIKECAPCPEGAVAFDRIVGNAAALLLQKASCPEVYSVLGSELAAETLERLGITFTFLKLVPCISNQAGDGMCPFEKASVGKSPEEFYQMATGMVRGR